MMKQWLLIASAVSAGLLIGGLLLFSVFAWVGSASAQTPTPDPDTLYKQMLQMMDAMHGAGTSERMLQVEGGEEIMRAGAQMMTQMQNMNGIGNMNEMMQQMMGGTR